ncbi:Internalin I [Frankliniella fusca]|uniref:Internalin I n=1 Tax=Frankliniella fusca TaxID=407009 RepID=A0AAE1I0Z8_9NEOP|nr:Internalin I [Frankliniella fusca]
MIPIQDASYKLHSLRQQQSRHPGDEKDAKFHQDRQFCIHNLLTSTGDILDAVQIDGLIAPRCNIQQREEQNVKEMITQRCPDFWKYEDKELLRDVSGVDRLLGVRCYVLDTFGFRRKLLDTAAPSIKVLSIDGAWFSDLLTVHTMPHLRSLKVSGDAKDTGLNVTPNAGQLSTLAARQCGLTWLHVHSAGLPLAIMTSLLKAHAHTLETLQLRMGTETDQVWSKNHPKPWLWDSRELVAVMEKVREQCRMRALRRVLVLRKPPSVCHPVLELRHDVVACAAHLAALRWRLPGAQVLCDICDGVAPEEL